MIDEASLYIHIPFCVHRCDYCDFYSIPVTRNTPLSDIFVDRVLADAKLLFANIPLRRIPTIYIGGGTPSVLGEKELGRMIDGLARYFPNKPEEFTLEVNAESAGKEFMKSMRAHGVDRISVGVQTFNEASRRAIKRRGSIGNLERALGHAADLFPGRVSADLITGLPGQDERTLDYDINHLLSFYPDHVSLYALTLEDGTPLTQRYKAGWKDIARIPPPEKADELWLHGRDRLEASGFFWYEVSNFARDGAISLHNMRYWRMESWLSFGPASSATTIDDGFGLGVRRTVARDVFGWLNRRPEETPYSHGEYLDPLILKKEIFLMGFRTYEGPSPALWEKRFGFPLEQAAPRVCAAWRKRGLLSKNRMALTRCGRLLLAPFLIEAFRELEEREPAVYTA